MKKTQNGTTPRKLVLRHEAIALLGNHQLRDVAGGSSGAVCTVISREALVACQML